MNHRSHGPTEPTLVPDLPILAQFPIALLSDHPKEGDRVRVYTEAGKRWQLAGHAALGLPTPPDLALLLVLFQLSEEQGHPEQVTLTYSDLVKRQGLAHASANYRRTQLSLQRWHGLAINTDNSYFDLEEGVWERQRDLHLLEETDLMTRGGNPTRFAGRPFPCWVRFSTQVRQHLQE